MAFDGIGEGPAPLPLVALVLLRPFCPARFVLQLEETNNFAPLRASSLVSSPSQIFLVLPSGACPVLALQTDREGGGNRHLQMRGNQRL
ncbi:uncharacterized protein P884DRAFT_103440 [Thermothelomyces heterothallicus CBS 202.75]|uniref:uncharacterized protein n=1 Tax=Thermothelomyces heterothallicus CBS 202.75 TaxID=1149848 RepID=UPI003742CA0B